MVDIVLWYSIVIKEFKMFRDILIWLHDMGLLEYGSLNDRQWYREHVGGCWECDAIAGWLPISAGVYDAYMRSIDRMSIGYDDIYKLNPMEDYRDEFSIKS